MNMLIKRLVLSLSLVGGVLLPTPKTTAQQLTNSNPQFVETSSLRTGRADDLVNLLSSQYVAKDINGQEYDIDAILKSGKAILIDFSTTWCKYCWELHNYGTLEKLYAKFGPEGTKQLEVFWVEAEGASKSTIQDPNKDWTKDSNGKPVPYPLFSDSKMASSLGIYLTAYPILVLVGPGNKWIECSDELLTSAVDFKKFESLLGLFITKKDKPQDVTISSVTDLYVGETYPVRLSYTTVAPVTKITWTAPEGVTLKKVSDTEYSVTADKIGSYGIEVTVSNENGSTTSIITVTVSKPISSYPFFCSMDVKTQLDKGWRSIDYDGDGFGFESFMGKGLVDRLKLEPKEYAKQGAEKSTDYLISWGTFLPMQAQDTPEGTIFSGAQISPTNELRSAPLEIPSDALKPTFSCYIASYLYAEKENELKVMISEPNGTPVELLAPQKLTETWTQISADLSAYKGKTILLSLVPLVNGSSAILVDQLRVTMDGSTNGETSIPSIQTTLYPNPATDYVTIRTGIGSTIEFIASDGTKLHTMYATDEETTIPLAQLPAGYYLVQITSLEGDVVCRSLIIK